MPLKKFLFGPLFWLAWPENRLPMHRIVVVSVLKIFLQALPNFKLSGIADRDVTQIKQAVNIGSQ
jgi:hypothetical protein